MSGGIAYVLDEDRDLYLRLNKELVTLDKRDGASTTSQELRDHDRGACGGHRLPQGQGDSGQLRASICLQFKKILPRDYDRMLRSIAQLEEQGMSREQAEIEAFYAMTNER